MKFLKIKTILIAVLVLGAFFVGRHLGNAPSGTHTGVHKEKSMVKDWTCSMHPQIRQPRPGKCPICAMDLIPVSTGAEDTKGDLPEIKLTESAEKLAEIETVPVERKFVPAEIRLTGKVAYNEMTMAYITAWFPGRIDRLFVNYTGIAVKKGDHVAEIYSPELLVAQQEVFQALKLASGKDTPDKDSFAERTIKSVRDKFRLWGFSDGTVDEIINRGKVSDHLTVTAPISGIVVEKNAYEGMYFKTGDNLFTIADLSKVWIMLDAYESDLPWLRYGQKVEFTAESYPGDVFAGRISFINPVLDKMTRTVKVRVDADNSDGRLKPEMFVHATVRSEIAENGKVMDTSLAGKWISPMHPEVIKDKPGKCDICEMDLVPAETLGYVNEEQARATAPLVIPASAPLLTGRRAVVYVRKAKGVFEGRMVALGPRAGDYYIVQSGLAEGDKVVVNGNFKIDSSLQILAKPSMMSMEEKEDSHKAVDEQGKNINRGSETAPSESLLNSYFAVQKALAHDNLDEAIKNAKELDKHYSTVLAASKDLTGARENFLLLSERIYENLRKTANASEKKIHRFYCPMAFNNKGAYWLQESAKIENPYFGETMLKCGEKVDGPENR